MEDETLICEICGSEDAYDYEGVLLCDRCVIIKVKQEIEDERYE